MDLVGIGVGGSGGVKEGRAKEMILEGIRHLVAMEAVEQCADHASEWIGAEMRRWRKQKARFNTEWGKMTRQEKSQISEKYKEMQGGPPQRKPKKESKI
jgi:hypothetical protein